MQTLNTNLDPSQANPISMSPNSSSSVTTLLYPHHSSTENYQLYQHNLSFSNTQANLSHFHSTSHMNNLNTNNNNNLSTRSNMIFPNPSSPSNMQQNNASLQNSHSNIKIIYKYIGQ
jgi:hypothetical protein